MTSKRRLTLISPKMEAALAKQRADEARAKAERAGRAMLRELRKQRRTERDRAKAKRERIQMRAERELELIESGLIADGLPITCMGDVWWVPRTTLGIICARIDGLRLPLLLTRLQRGWPLLEAIDPESGRRRATNAARDSNGRYLTCQGRTQLMADWSRETGIKRVTIRERLKHGWSVELALTVPPRPKTRGPERDQWIRCHGDKGNRCTT